MIIPGFSRYNITEDGVITNRLTDKELTPQKTRIYDYYTYMHVTLYDDEGKRRNCNVMRLLAITFLGKPDVPSTARAKDGDNTNTVLSNVEWVPYKECTRQSWQNGKMLHRKSRKSSVTKDFVDLLYDTLCLYDEPVTVTELSNVLEVPYSMARYGMVALRQIGKAEKVMKGFEAIR